MVRGQQWRWVRDWIAEDMSRLSAYSVARLGVLAVCGVCGPPESARIPTNCQDVARRRCNAEHAANRMCRLAAGSPRRARWGRVPWSGRRALPSRLAKVPAPRRGIDSVCSVSLWRGFVPPPASPWSCPPRRRIRAAPQSDRRPTPPAIAHHQARQRSLIITIITSLKRAACLRRRAFCYQTVYRQVHRGWIRQDRPCTEVSCRSSACRSDAARLPGVLADALLAHLEQLAELSECPALATQFAE